MSAEPRGRERLRELRAIARHGDVGTTCKPLLPPENDRARRAPTDGSSGSGQSSRPQTRAGASDPIQPSAASRRARRARTARARLAIQRANGSVNPCFGRRTIVAAEADARAFRAAAACRASACGTEPSSRPHGVEQHVIDKRHAHFEPCAIDITSRSRSSCEPRYRRVSSRATSPAALARRRREQRALRGRTLDGASRHTPRRAAPDRRVARLRRAEQNRAARDTRRRTTPLLDAKWRHRRVSRSGRHRPPTRRRQPAHNRPSRRFARDRRAAAAGTTGSRRTARRRRRRTAPP